MVKYWAIAAAIGSLAMTGWTETIFKPFDADKGSVSMDARQRAILSVERDAARTAPDRLRRAQPGRPADIAASAGLSGSRRARRNSRARRNPPQVRKRRASGHDRRPQPTIQPSCDGLYRACEAYMNGVGAIPATASSWSVMAGSWSLC